MTTAANAALDDAQARLKGNKGKVIDYVVLELMPPPEGAEHDAPVGSWRECGTAKASTQAEAVKAIVAERAGTFRAVSLMAWKGSITRQQKTILDEVEGE
jgi:hypothetical protein